MRHLPLFSTPYCEQQHINRASPGTVHILTWRTLSAVLLLLLVSGCGQAGQQESKQMKTFQNPVIKTDFPDPSIIHVGNTFYAYATNANGKHIQVARSHDLVNWDLLPDAMPTLPSWAQSNGSYVWAPDVIQIGQKFVMYYTARDIQSDRQCVGVATSDTPEGPFKDTHSHPLVCQADLGGTIDPSPFRDGEKLYLYFKNDGNCCGQPTHLWAQEMAPDGLSVVGQPHSLMVNDAPWEGNVVEAPNMFQHNGKYYLFFSAANYADQTYAVGYALCQSATGPCTQAAENPILASQMAKKPPVIGPGGQTMFQVGTQSWMIYHAWDVNTDGSRGDSRFTWIDRVTWENDKPHVHGPTTDPQPLPLQGK